MRRLAAMKYRLAGATYLVIAEKLTEERAQAFAVEKGISFDLMALENARLDQYAGIGLIAGGVLLATLWADTPVAESLTFTPLRGGGSLGASFWF